MQFLTTIWIFIQDQILGMRWLSSLIGEFLYSIGLDTSGKIGGSIQFFIYDVIKIVFLLCVLIFIISYIQFPYFISNGGHWVAGAIDEYLWNESGSGLCVARSCDCSFRWNTYRKTSP